MPGGLSVSVVIPAWNEEASIGPLLDSLLCQTCRPDEILVVDAGSSDNTAKIVQSYRLWSPRIRLLSIGRAHPGVARNAGTRSARHDFIAFTDCGMRLDAGWLQALRTPMERAPATEVVYGSYEPVTDTLFRQCAAVVYVSPKTQRGHQWLRGPVVASCLLRRSVWRAVGEFPPYRAAEDLIFIERIAQHGCTVAYAPDAVTHWELSADLASLVRKYTTYSFHNLVAGRGRYWHAGVARAYVAGLPFLWLGLRQSHAWFLVLAVGGAARVARAFHRQRRESWSAPGRDPRRWLMVGLTMLALDAATGAGWLWWIWRTVRGGFRPPSHLEIASL